MVFRIIAKTFCFLALLTALSISHAGDKQNISKEWFMKIYAASVSGHLSDQDPDLSRDLWPSASRGTLPG